jgi:1,4-alpha-glucan branching enzyme
VNGGHRVTVPASVIDPADLRLLAAGEHHDPHRVLGAHPQPDGTLIATLRPHADAVHARVGGVDHPLAHVAHGVFAALIPVHDLVDYRLVVDYPGGHRAIAAEGYRFLPTLGELDLHLFAEGRHERLWDCLGAHPRAYTTPDGPVTGVSFAVWAPNARGVTVVGDFDGWSGNAAPMRSLGSSGVWELFVPDIGAGTLYKFRVHGCDGRVVDHADPFAFRTEAPPATASIVRDDERFEWHDADWMRARAQRRPFAEAMSVYEVHLGSWRPGLDYRAAAAQLAEYVTARGFTHVELLPIAEHPFGGSWGYQVSSYYAPTARYGGPADFQAFVDTLHTAGVGVIVDWVPAHFPKDEWALARFDGTPLYEHGDPRRGEQLDWGTYVFDFGRREVRNFLVANALFWLDEYHIDGLRVDAVASMLYLDYSRPAGGWEPNVHGGRENLEAVGFLQEMNATVHKHHPGVVTVAEESTAWPGVTRPTSVGGLGFSMKWNMGWMHDTLGYLGHDPVHRSYHHNEVTFSLMYAFSEHFVLPISHDEVVHGKGTLWSRMPGDDFAKAAGVRALLAYMWAHPGKQLLFMGQEFGQQHEWSAERGVDWWLLDDGKASIAAAFHRGIGSMVTDLNAAYRARPALWSQDSTPAGFSWIDANDSQGNVLSFLRTGSDGLSVACLFNFSGSQHSDYRVGLPEPGRWREILNTDAAGYGGGGRGNLGAVEADELPWHGRPASASVTVPPLSAVWLERG